MLSLKKLLGKITEQLLSIRQSTTTTNRLTPATGSGSVEVLQFGKIVMVTAQIAITTAISSGTRLITGLPQPKVNNASFIMMNSNASTESAVPVYLNIENGTGSVRIAEAKAAANRSYRISFAYIAA